MVVVLSRFVAVRCSYIFTGGILELFFASAEEAEAAAGGFLERFGLDGLVVQRVRGCAGARVRAWIQRTFLRIAEGSSMVVDVDVRWDR